MHKVYTFQQECALSEARIRRLLIGLNWTVAELDDGGMGCCYSPLEVPRDLTWPGTIVGTEAKRIVPWLQHWNPAEAAVGGAVINAIINTPRQIQTLGAEPLPIRMGYHHLSVFEYFSPQVQGAKICIIGRYPGLAQLEGFPAFTCIERRPGPSDLPDVAAEFELPEADWVFLTASSISNKSLPQLLRLCQNAQVVLMGPSLPWLEQWRDFGVNYLAGVTVIDTETLFQVVAEAGGTRIFGSGVQYCVAAL